MPIEVELEDFSESFGYSSESESVEAGKVRKVHNVKPVKLPGADCKEDESWRDNSSGCSESEEEEDNITLH